MSITFMGWIEYSGNKKGDHPVALALRSVTDGYYRGCLSARGRLDVQPRPCRRDELHCARTAAGMYVAGFVIGRGLCVTIHAIARPELRTIAPIPALSKHVTHQSSADAPEGRPMKYLHTEVIGLVGD